MSEEKIYRVMNLTKKQLIMLWNMKDICDEFLYNSLDIDDKITYNQITEMICYWNKEGSHE
jgi:hypothetical protein